jgi:hypothetical protein
MKKCILIVTIVLLALTTHSEILNITGFNDGTIKWSNSVPDISNYRVEWTSRLDGNWSSNYDSFNNIQTTQNCGTIKVPMFYRIVGNIGNRTIFWTDAVNNQIWSVNEDGSNRSLILTDTNTGSIHNIATDSIRHKIYWTFQLTNPNPNKLKITRADFNGSNIEDIVYQNMEVNFEPSLVVDESNQKIYWSNFTLNFNGNIFRANLNGSNIEAVQGYGRYSCIALDSVNQKLYWVDTTENSSVWSSNLDGIFPIKIMSFPNQLTGITVDTINNKIYCIDWLKNLWKMNTDGSSTQMFFKATGNNTITIDQKNAKLYWSGGQIGCTDYNGSYTQSIIKVNNPKSVYFAW